MKRSFGYRSVAVNFELVPAAERAEYFPVSHVAPEQDDSIPAGFDLGSNPRFAETLSRARDQGRMAASGRIAYPAATGRHRVRIHGCQPGVWRERPGTDDRPAPGEP